jgi:hypothetical protein
MFHVKSPLNDVSCLRTVVGKLRRNGVGAIAGLVVVVVVVVAHVGLSATNF